MIEHKYVNASDDSGMYQADQVGRQAVTFEWFIKNMNPDSPLWFYSEECAKLGLDPWREITDYDIATNWNSWWAGQHHYAMNKRVYVQKRDMIEQGALVKEQFANYDF